MHPSFAGHAKHAVPMYAVKSGYDRHCHFFGNGAGESDKVRR